MEPPLHLEPQSISIMTYNLLYPQRPGGHADSRSSAIGYRFDRKTNTIVENSETRIGVALGNIRRNLTDVICFQELTMRNYQLLTAKLGSDYACLFQLHHQKSVHGVAIFYRYPKFRFLNIQSKPFRGPPTRTHLVIDLLLTNAQKIIRLACCHLIDPRGMRSEDKPAQIIDILNMMKPVMTPYHIHAYVIAGDFNQDQWGDAPKKGKINNKPTVPNVSYATLFQPLIKTGYRTDNDYSPSECKRKLPSTQTRDPEDPNLYSQMTVYRKRRIDYIWIRTQDPESIKPLDLKSIILSASDHAPVGSTFNV